MKHQVEFSIPKIGQQKIDKSNELQKWSSHSQPQILCQYKFYPTYLTAEVIQMKVEDIKCNEVVSRFIIEKTKELQQRSLVG